MTLIYRIRLALIILSLCVLLSVVPLASAQFERMLISREQRNFSPFGQFNQAERSTRNPIGVTVATLDGMGDLIGVTEGGPPNQFTMQLNEEPVGTIKIYYVGGRFSDIHIIPSQLTFTPDNWDIPQVVSVYAPMDYVNGSPGLSINDPLMYQGEVIVDGIYDYANLNFNNFEIYAVNVPRTVPTEPLIVTTLADSVTEEIDGSLRQMLHIAKARAGVDIITFAPDLAGTINLMADLPNFRGSSSNQNLHIVGPGQNQLTINGSGVYKGFIGSNQSLTLEQLTLANMPNAIDTFASNLILQDVTIRGSGQGLSLIWGYPAVAVNEGEIVINRVTMEENYGVFGGALISTNGTIITNSSFRNNISYPIETPTYTLSNAGAIAVEGILTIHSSTFVGNSGALAGAIAPVTDSWSAGIKIINSTFSGNIATQPGGAAAIYADAGNILFSTFSGHNTGLGSGGIVKSTNPNDDGTGDYIHIQGSVFANNSAANPIECVGNVGGRGNFSVDPSCVSSIGYMGIPTGVDSVLRDNGGLTMNPCAPAGQQCSEFRYPSDLQ